MSLQDAKLILTSNGYKAGKVYAVKPTDGTGDATVTRNTTKTRFTSAGILEDNAVNVLAPDYRFGGCPFINVEEQRTNEILHSEKFDNAYWNKTNLSVSATTTPSADWFEVTANGANTSHVLSAGSGTLTSGNQYVISAIVEKGTQDKIQLTFSTGSSSGLLTNYANFDLTNLTSNKGSFIESSGVTPLINNLYLIAMSFTANGTSTNSGAILGFINSLTDTRAPAYATSNSFKLRHVQTEIGTGPTSSIITTTTTATRSADTVTVPIPSGTTEIIEKYEDGTTNTITTIPASPYTVPTGKRYEYILMR